AAAERLGEALALWQGEPLADFTFETFASVEIARLLELRAIAGERWVEAQLALGHLTPEVHAAIERLVAADPTRESFRELQMLALYRSGRHLDALRAFEDLRRALADVGLEPGPSLLEVQHRVLVHDPSLRAPREGARAPQRPIVAGPQPDRAADHGADRPRFVGQDDVLAQLHQLALAVDDGRPRCALIGGEPGIGKSRLAEELCALVGPDTSVAWGRAHDDDGAPPMWPWVQVLRDLGVGSMALDDRERDTLGALLPELGGGDVLATDVNAARFRLYDAVRGVLSRVGAARRRLVVLDDLQWADASAVRLLHFLATERFAGRVLFVGLFHEPTDASPGSFGATVADLSTRELVRRQTLPGLRAADVADLIGPRSDLAPADLAALAERLHARTGGNAFFLTELIGLLGSERRLGTAALDAVGSDIPTVVADVIRRRMQRLPHHAQQALSVAAVIGREFSLDVVRR
ncbi:MAG: AAA family ATPase, partial [Actinobacteria bacterium]|nr:AAA family ATPase [Actinomycetota bacterium]